MTNAQIITKAMQVNKVTEEVDTYAGWRRRGYQVKRGQRATFKTMIWKPCTKKAEKKDGSDQNKEVRTGDMILVHASFFAKSQVEECQK